MGFGDGHDCLREDDPCPNLVDVEGRMVLAEFNSAVAKVCLVVDVVVPTWGNGSDERVFIGHRGVAVDVLEDSL